MKIETGTYIFECYTMPWTDKDLGLPVGGNYIEIAIELTDDDINSIKEMFHWAWDNNWFEHSVSETVCTQLLQKHNYQLYEKVQLKAHKAFCEAHPNYENAVDFGVYEIFPPDEIQDFARNTYKPSEHRD